MRGRESQGSITETVASKEGTREAASKSWCQHEERQMESSDRCVWMSKFCFICSEVDVQWCLFLLQDPVCDSSFYCLMPLLLTMCIFWLCLVFLLLWHFLPYNQRKKLRDEGYFICYSRLCYFLLFLPFTPHFIRWRFSSLSSFPCHVSLFHSWLTRHEEKRQ